MDKNPYNFPIVKCFLFLFLLLSICQTSFGDPITDPYDANNLFSIKTTPSGQILPKAFAQYATSGSFMSRLGSGAAGSPPSPSAVVTIIEALVSASSGSSTISLAIWSFAIAFVGFGCTLSGLITFKAISAGKEPPGLGAVKWIGKSMVAILMVNYVASAMPRTLISICDTFSSQAGDWIPQGQVNKNAIQTIANRISINYYLKWTNWHREVAKRIAENYKLDPSKKTTMINALDTGIREGRTQFAQAKITAQTLGGDSTADAESTNQRISDELKKGMGEAVKSIDTQVNLGFDSISEKDTGIRGNILDKPTIDLAGLAYPVKIIRIAMYTAFVYIAISLWSLPIAVLMWASVFSLPTQWGMANILYSGIKVMLTILLTVILVMIYSAGTLSGEQEKGKAFELSELWHPIDTATRWASGSDSMFGSFCSFFSGNSTDLLIASMLIFTAPAQAAGIIKGANGIAESAKSAMLSGGAAGGTKQIFGYGWGGASTSGSGGGGGGSGSVSLNSFQKNMGPVP